MGATGELGRTDAFSVGPDGRWYEMAFRREVVLRRGMKGGASELGTEGDDAGTGADAGAGSARGTKNGRFAALRELGGSSEYREWMRGRAMGDCVVSMMGCGRYIGH